MAARRMINRHAHQKERVYRNMHISYMFDDNECYDRFRFRQETIDFIGNLIRVDIERKTRRAHAISVDRQVKLALRFYATGSFLNCVGDTIGYHKSTASRVVRDVSEALSLKSEQFIKWPTTDAEKNKSKEEFFQKANFPCVIGCVDCTHVRIQAPSDHEYAYVNRKNFHSINVQAICDSQGRFINVVANWPGSCHDSHIFRTSKIGRYLEDHHHGLDVDGVILGDSGYPCKSYLITPYLHPVNRSQEALNSAHKKTRVEIEQVFGRWKRRFHCLHGEIRMSPERVCKIIMACAVLHNIAIHMNEPVLADDVDDGDDDNDVNVYPQQQLGIANDGRRVRDHLANTYF